MASGGEVPGDGDTATAAEIDDLAPGIQSVEQRSDPGFVLLSVRVVSPVALRQGVIAAPDHLDGRIPRVVIKRVVRHSPILAARQLRVHPPNGDKR
jgi:hypothetical protein